MGAPSATTTYIHNPNHCVLLNKQRLLSKGEPYSALKTFENMLLSKHRHVGRCPAVPAAVLFECLLH